MTATPHPLRGQAARLADLRETLRMYDTSEMTTAEVVAACEHAVPDATIDEIATALRQTAAELTTEADALRASKAARAQ